MDFNSNYVEIFSHANEDFSSEGNTRADEYLLSKPEGAGGHGLSPDFNVASSTASGSKKGLKVVASGTLGVS